MHKGPNLTAIDPLTSQLVALFNPRLQAWHEHFALHGQLIFGLTPTGRATVGLLGMNHADRMELRAFIIQQQGKV